MIPSPARPITLIAALAVAFFAVSCAGAPKPGIATSASGESSANPRTADAGSFDPATVPAAIKSATFVDVRALIDSLNQIIRRQDYDAWLSNLTEEYIKFYSDPSVLAKYSEYPIIKRKGIKLVTLKDYFTNVVYPSRQDDKVDDIEFVGENLIKAIVIGPKGDRNILYMLEKHGDAWKIGIGR